MAPGKSRWFRFFAEDCDVPSRDAQCAHCGFEFDGGDEVASRRSAAHQQEEIFCSIGCGVIHERELSKCYDAAEAAKWAKWVA